MSNPFLSVIIPTYNRAHLIENTLLSVLSQSCDDFEIIVIDDGSTDNTEEVVTRFNNSKIQYYKVSNGERGKARNEGTKKAAGQYINWFDSDDEMLENHVSKIKELATEKNHPEVITLNYKIKEADSGKLSNDCISFTNGNLTNSLVYGNYLACNPVIVRIDIARTNQFSEDRAMSASEDYELWLRLRSQFTFLSSEVVTSHLIQHPDRSVNTMTNPIQLEERFLLFIKKTTENNDVSQYLGRNKSYFIMRNLLFLSVELAYHKHKKKAFKHLKKAFLCNPKAIFQRTFWGTVKHLTK